MATLIHSIEEAAAAVTPGERRFGQRLNSHLEDDYLVWFNVPVGRMRRYPDFVVLHPKRGLLVLEVKDWKVGDLRKLDKLRWEVFLGGKPKTEANPLEQARQCMIELVNQLNRDPQLCDEAGSYQGKLAFPYGWGVVLPNITRRQWNELLTEEQQELVLPGRRLICKDEMTESVDPLTFQERLWGMFEYSFGRAMTLPQIERVRWCLFPEVRIDAGKQAELFEDEPVPDLIKVLDLQQEQLARNLGGGHRVIHGVAGSGKTLILGYRCVQLAESLRQPALVLCYNISLAARLRRFIADRGLEEKVRVHHFHEWCGEMLRAYHVNVTPGDGKYWERQVESVIGGVEAGFIPRGQYGAVLIDEGHDFEPEWLKLVTQMVDPATDSFLLLYDDAQSIYRKTTGLGFSLSSVGVKAKGRTTILRLNYRNSREILKFAYDFAKGSLGPAAADDDHIPLIEPASAGMTGARPAFKLADDFHGEISYAARCVASWLERGIPANEIAVIYFKKAHGKAMSEKLGASKVDHLWMDSSADKKAYDPAAEKVTVVTAQSSKGHEFQAVVVIGVGSLDESEEEVVGQTRLLYVAMTRAKRQLAVTSCAPNLYGERLEESLRQAVVA
ncbi:3'-5' exonuclease [Haloferula sp.]|uniref:3'-5' exonuclease n=1 Tax=Haloferula sp. TaxID=2497595 RepID=UPI003C744FAF